MNGSRGGAPYYDGPPLAFHPHQQQQPQRSMMGNDGGGGGDPLTMMRRNSKSSGNLSGMRISTNQYTPNPYYPQTSRRISHGPAINNQNQHRRVRSNEGIYGSDNAGQGYESDVSNNFDGFGQYGANTARIIAERKRRATSSGELQQIDRPMRRASISSGDLQQAGRPMRRASISSGDLQHTGQHMGRGNTAENLQQAGRPMRRSTSGDLQQAGQHMRRVNTAGNLRVVQEDAVFRGSRVSDINDEFTEKAFNQYNPVTVRRQSSGNASNRSNEHTFPPGVGNRRRTFDKGSMRRPRSHSEERTNPQSGSADDTSDDHRHTNVGLPSDDFQQQLQQLRMEHRMRQEQQKQSPRRRSSSLDGSQRSVGLDYEKGEMEIVSAPLGVGLSGYARVNMNNPNQQMGALFREVQQMESLQMNKSEHSWYSKRDASRRSSGDLSRLSRRSSADPLGPLGISQHSKPFSVVGSNLAPSVKTNDDRLYHALLQGRENGFGKLRWHEKHSLSKRTIFIASGLIILAGAILGVVLFLSERNRGDGVSSVSNNSTKTPALVNHVIPPPSDIDGRCSPSNLPGSVPACLQACAPAACCYNFFDSGKKCFDANDSDSVKACNRYRPYCDIFYDTWDGATDGVLRTPQVSLVPTCQQINGKNEEQPSRLRGRNLFYRHLLIETGEEICEQYCEASKCCNAVIVVHPYEAGLELSASGVYIDATTKEYVVTNCQEDLVYQKNKDLCAEYDKFCDWKDAEEYQSSGTGTGPTTLDPASAMTPSTSSGNLTDAEESQMAEAWTSRPTLDPASTMTPTLSPRPSHTPTVNVFQLSWRTQQPIIRPSMKPSKSSSPSQKYNTSSQPSLSSMSTIPPANIAVIEDVCAGADNIALLTNGNETARLNCLNACMNGLCCYVEQLGYDSFIESCYIGNEVVCEGYSNCLWLQQSEEVTLDTSNETSIDYALNSSIVSNETMITNANNLSSLNTSLAATTTDFTPLNLSTIVDDGPFILALNSTTISNDTTVIHDGTSIIVFDDETFPPLNSTAISIDTTEGALPPETISPPPSDLAALCALSGSRFCEEVCKVASCCFEEQPDTNCDINEEICKAYAPCSVLFQQGS